MITLIYVDKEGNPFGISREEYDSIPKTKLKCFKVHLIEKDLIPEQYLDSLCIIGCLELGKNEVEIKGIEKPCIGYFWENELGWREGIIGYKEDEKKVKARYEEETKCKFLFGKMQCSLKKDYILCEKRKSLGECPIDKGIPGGSSRVIWGIWLDHGGNKNISVEDFMKLTLSDLSPEMLKDLDERIHIAN